MREDVQEIITAALQAVDPMTFIPKVLHREQDKLMIDGKIFELQSFHSVYLIAIGKAALRMTVAVDSVLGDVVTKGIVLTKHIGEKVSLDGRYQLIKGGHPVPNEGSLNGAKAILDLLGQTEANDLVLFLISGGGSALMCCPRDGVSLENLQHFSEQVLACGADINEFNILRKHLDLVKGGGLALQAAPALCVSIILSDVVGSDMSTIASGPTIPDPSTFADAWQILEKYKLVDSVPPAIRDIFQKGMSGLVPETMKAGDACCSRVTNCLAADNRIAALAAAENGRQLGFNSVVLSTTLTGEASSVGAALPSLLSEVDQPDAWIRRPALLILGGETTVHIHGTGKGGRNQELALAAVRAMASLKDCALITLATDGEDGPTDAAGALVTDKTLSAGAALGLDPESFLANNDAWNYFSALDGLVKTGPSGTNVNDLTFLIAF